MVDKVKTYTNGNVPIYQILIWIAIAFCACLSAAIYVNTRNTDELEKLHNSDMRHIKYQIESITIDVREIKGDVKKILQKH